LLYTQHRLGQPTAISVASGKQDKKYDLQGWGIWLRVRNKDSSRTPKSPSPQARNFLEISLEGVEGVEAQHQRKV
jgi:hypothetical protein